ncbi:unnamed protein product [Symbiodinium natans]|uniref:Uncharacterized protein n=1 Tax=Symbiodinium natans TaxID=878477 RepID=A0A812S2P6_9DINO|nr:unnamed protein product [Symbiodinium natans]
MCAHSFVEDILALVVDTAEDVGAHLNQQFQGLGAICLGCGENHIHASHGVPHVENASGVLRVPLHVRLHALHVFSAAGARQAARGFSDILMKQIGSSSQQ